LESATLSLIELRLTTGQIEHLQALALVHRLLKNGGRIVFAGEPIIAPQGPWKDAVPYPWGPRLDGLSIRAMKTHGWMELGFQEPYFRQALERSGFAVEKYESPTSGLAHSFIAHKT